MGKKLAQEGPNRQRRKAFPRSKGTGPRKTDRGPRHASLRGKPGLLTVMPYCLHEW